MLFHNALRRKLLHSYHFSSLASFGLTRELHYDARNRLSTFWTPSYNRKDTEAGDKDGHDFLLRAGFLRQAHSGIFHLLPLGLRVQDKIERLIDKHMLKLGASKVSLSSFSSEELWRRSGRLEGRDSEFFRLLDRKEGRYLLSPTHEEEITTILSNAVQSYKDLPLRIYQISRKYRDEARPRHGLLRGREFVMKDLYTFDATEPEAKQSYEQVRGAYSALLSDLKLPFITASADSGKMGGNLSHEYHLASPIGEDTIIRCDKCDYSVNEELYVGLQNDDKRRLSQTMKPPKRSNLWTGISRDRETAVFVWYPDTGAEINSAAIKGVFPGIDLSVEDPLSLHQRSKSQSYIILQDAVLLEKHQPNYEPYTDLESESYLRETQYLKALLDGTSKKSLMDTFREAPVAKIGGRPIRLTKATSGDQCPQCSEGTLSLHKAVEIGHTFHLGTRYSKPLDLKVLNAENRRVYVEMGCHGIGVSRLIGALASLLADEKGLNWPLAIAPFGVMIVPTGHATSSEDVDTLYDQLVARGCDAAIDDRERPLGWKLKDADLVGYPFIVVMGKAWSEKKAVELQCRRLSVKEELGLGELAEKIAEYGQQL